MKEAWRHSRLPRRSLLAGLATAPGLLRPISSWFATGWSESNSGRLDAMGETGTKLMILGSGAGPSPMLPGRTRHMSSYLMVSNGAAYVLDCGLGVTNQFARSGIPFSAVRSIFITHHHPDHNIEYGPFLILG